VPYSPLCSAHTTAPTTAASATARFAFICARQ
jgi:hypothetical protein